MERLGAKEGNPIRATSEAAFRDGKRQAEWRFTFKNLTPTVRLADRLFHGSLSRSMFEPAFPSWPAGTYLCI